MSDGDSKDGYRRTFLKSCVSGLFASALPAFAQPAARVYRVAWVRFTVVPRGGEPKSQPNFAPFFNVYQERLAERGFVQGRNLDLQVFYAKSTKTPAWQEEIVRQTIAWKPDLIQTGGPTATQLVQKATSTIPIVFSAVGDPVKGGLVKSMARPEGNATGVSEYTEHLKLKQLQLAREVFPLARRFALISDASAGHDDKALRSELRGAASGWNLALDEVDAATEGNLRNALEKLAAIKPAAVITVGLFTDPQYLDHFSSFQTRSQIPVLCDHFLALDRGATVIWLSEDYRDHFRKAADIAARILMGAKPAEIPVDASSRIQLVVNAGIARRLGITIPQSVLARADRIIE